MEKVKSAVQNLLKGPEKWLLVSAFGAILCITSLALYFTGGGAASTPVPKTVVAQVFGFNPYYFVKDEPPEGLKLDVASVKFLDNSFSFNLVDGKKQRVTISQRTPVTTGQATPKGNTQPLTTSLGSAQVSPIKNGNISATLVTQDLTEITVSSSDFLNTTIMQEIYNTMAPIDRVTGSPKLPE